jgi:hypothetical protein
MFRSEGVRVRRDKGGGIWKSVGKGLFRVSRGSNLPQLEEYKVSEPRMGFEDNEGVQK